MIKTTFFFWIPAVNRQQQNYSTEYLIANEGDDTYKINVSIWNAHKDPIYGHTKYVHNWTIQEVIVEYAIVKFQDDSDDVWILDDGRKCSKNMKYSWLHLLIES